MKRSMFLIGLLAAVMLFASGCKSMSDTAQKISDDLGDKALQAHAFVDIWKFTPSDPATNSSPSVKKVTIIGDVKSIPLTSKNGEYVKNYAEYRYTETPAWYNSSNVTKEECYIATGDNVEDLKKWVEERKKKQEASSAASSALSVQSAAQK